MAREDTTTKPDMTPAGDVQGTADTPQGDIMAMLTAVNRVPFDDGGPRVICHMVTGS